MKTYEVATTPEARARRRVRDLRGFYRLLLVAAFVVALTFAINALTAPGHWWFLWVAFGLGLTVTLRGARLALRDRLFGPDWEERKVREILARETH